MMNPLLSIFTFRGEISRGAYLLCGVILVAVKYNLDRLMAFVVFDRDWYFWSYWRPHELYPIHRLPPDDRQFYLSMMLLALPFLWIGLVLTVRRLRDANLPLSLVLLFFVPIVNLLFFAFVTLVPSRPETEVAERSTNLGRFIPESRLGSAALAIGLTAALAVPTVWFSVSVLEHYGWGVFVAIPFTIGFLTVLIFSFHQERRLADCLGLAVSSVALTGLLIFFVAIEGIVCLIMAAPIAAPLGLLGGWLGWLIRYGSRRPADFAGQACMLPLLLPGVIYLDARESPPPPLMEVESQIVIRASLERVWNLVVDFPELDPPSDLLFRAGIAYPVRAEIEGEGVGAVRYCVFSTGPFVEPITHWDPPYHLAFAVTDQPSPLQEWSIYSRLRTPHIDGFLRSERGEFRLEELADGSTLLKGTTWYRNEIWPINYWRLWSDWIIGRIHFRVLDHVRVQSEMRAASSG